MQRDFIPEDLQKIPHQGLFNFIVQCSIKVSTHKFVNPFSLYDFLVICSFSISIKYFSFSREKHNERKLKVIATVCHNESD